VKLEIQAAGRTRAVEVSRTGDRFLVSIDGREHDVDVKEIDGVLSLLIGGRALSGPPTRSYEVTVGETMVHVDGIPVEVSIVPSRPAWGSQGKGQTSQGDGPQQIKAPMPGKIVKLLVKPGDKVDARQGLVVVEAMKMENELKARAAGTVSEVRVTEGSSVEAGAILVVLE
jgi:biotin carboxyl carrier protein